MAYNRGYNPDALPAHVQPDEAAAIITGSSNHSTPHPTSYSSKPPPPLPKPSASSSSVPRYDERDRYGALGGRTPSQRDYDRYDRYDRPGAAPPVDPRYDHRGGGYGGYGSPPPQTYAYGSLGPAPPPASHGRPPAASRPPASPAFPKDANDREGLWKLFMLVDKDRTGQLSERELRSALVNGDDWTSFDPHTVRMMIRMFDTDRSGTINFDEFCGLWGFLLAWRELFNRFDRNGNGNIDLAEFGNALKAFGYRLSPEFVALLFRTYDRRSEQSLSFDLFVQACISLKRMTDVFKKYDEDRDGYITLSFEEFLTEIMKQMS